MFASCLEKQQKVKEIFSSCTTQDLTYEKIMDLGRTLTPIDPSARTEENRVEGCQSRMYLTAALSDGKITFHAESDALISAGLAALLLLVYSGEPPEVVLTCPPTYLEELHIPGALTPGRANGLYSLHLRMKRQALHFLSNRS